MTDFIASRFTLAVLDLAKSTDYDKPWDMREFGIRTIDGHRIMFGQELSSHL